MPQLYIIAGCNGAGKTTASYTVLPKILHCKEFVNADSIAAGLSPFNPESVALEAGRIMLRRIDELMKDEVDFAFETTLAARSYVSLVQRAQEIGYEVTLLFFWLKSPEMAMRRVEERVKNGGHNIPNNVIERRYFRGLYNLLHLFIPISDNWIIVNNSSSLAQSIAEGRMENEKLIINNDIWNTIQKQSEKGI